MVRISAAVRVLQNIQVLASTKDSLTQLIFHDGNGLYFLVTSIFKGRDKYTRHMTYSTSRAKRMPMHMMLALLAVESKNLGIFMAQDIAQRQCTKEEVMHCLWDEGDHFSTDRPLQAF